jgi:hypothetical protein
VGHALKDFKPILA